MKTWIRRNCAIVLTIICCAGLIVSVSAAERASSYISRYTANVAAAGNGKVEVMFSIVANKRVSQLGASYILLEESNDGGNTWSTDNKYENESWMSSTNRSTYARAIIYQGTIGHKYRVTAEVFAKDDNGGDTRTTPTSPTVTAIE